MRQFMTDNKAAFTDLEERAKAACIRFPNQEMPPMCSPEHTDIGFEIDGETGKARLFVAKNLCYTGENIEVQGWIQNSMKQFSSFADLVEWIQGPLRASYTDASVSAAVPDGADKSDSITDMEAVKAGMPDPHRPLYLDEEEILSRLQNKVFGQEGALRVLSSIIVRHLARRHPARPAVAFAVGPTGIGKTRSAEVLAQILSDFDDQCTGYQFLRLDMSEYQESHRISQLLGAPQGYVGHGEGSQLIDALKANPRTIVLFDEIEKAHPSILRALMNAMDAGRISSASNGPGGREIDCRHSVFMFTSNLDAKSILEELESRKAFGNRTVEDEVCRRRLNAAGLAPEIVGRIGRFLVYQPLTPEIRAEIVTLTISEIAKEYGLHVTFVDPEVILELMKKAGSHNFGVRPERFLIDDMLGHAFSEAAKQNISSPVRVTGVPFTCVPEEQPENEDKD